MIRVLVLATALENPRPLCHYELELRAAATGAPMRAGGVVGKAMATHTSALSPNRHTLALTLLALPHPAFLCGHSR